ncbi:MAG: hypothetical protein WAM73_20105 [Desulfobacterales bacterium]
MGLHRLSGNIIESYFFPQDRYHFENRICKTSEGWKQLDTGSGNWEFGIWVHDERREIVTYCEGVVRRIICADDNRLSAELAALADAYIPTLVTLIVTGRIPVP